MGEINKFHRRNFITLSFEGFFFMLAITMFSQENILHLYIFELSNNPSYIGLTTAIFYGFGYLMYLFAGIIGIGAKSPKFINIFISSFQRLAFLLILISSFFAGTNPKLSVGVFFLALIIYSISRGLTNPLFTQMVSVSIHRDLGLFYGTYSLFGSIGAFIGSFLIGKIFLAYPFPKDFSLIFLIGTIGGILATVLLIFGIREDTKNRKVERIGIIETFNIYGGILKSNKRFKRFTIGRVLMTCVEFITPYYIIHGREVINDGAFISNMILIFTLAKMISSIFLGKLTDKFNPTLTLFISAIFGLMSGIMVIFAKDRLSFYILYGLISISINGVYLATDVSSIRYSNRERTAFYVSLIGVLSAPFSIVLPFFGIFLESFFGIYGIFSFGIGLYIMIIFYLYFTKTN